MKNNNVRYADINKKLITLSKNIGKLNRKKKLSELDIYKRLPLLYNTQVIINEAYNINMSLLCGKEGHIRSKMISVRNNGSARSVITPCLQPIKINECIMPYLDFLELYKFRILNVLINIDGMQLKDAENKWNMATVKFDERIYEIMQSLITKSYNGRGLYIYLNRNPSLKLGSWLLIRIKDVKKDIHDVTLNVSNYILGLIAGDYDGDVLAQFMTVDDVEVQKNHLYNPIEMIIKDGKVNKDLLPFKDQIIGFVAFNKRTQREI